MTKEERAAKDKQRIDTNRDFILEYLKGKSCEVCGETDQRTFQFDHLDHSTKKLSISIMVKRKYKIESIQKEIDKCQILCANCHQIKSLKEQNSYRTR